MTKEPGLSKYFQGNEQVISQMVGEILAQVQQAASEQIGQVLEIIEKQNQEHVEAILNAVGELTAQVTTQWHEQIDSFTKPIEEMLATAEINANVVAPLLSKANLWLPPSMTLDLLFKLKRLTGQDDVTTEEVEQTFIEYYELENWSELHNMVSSWGDNPYFAQRMPIILDALEAHIGGKYRLSIPTLLPQIEGIVSGILERPAGEPTALMKDAIRDKYQDFFLRAASKDILIKLVTSPVLFGGVESKHHSPDKYPAWLTSKGLTESQSLNRHAILHGVQINYDSKIHSLRCFLLLDVLNSMRRDEWDEKLKP